MIPAMPTMPVASPAAVSTSPAGLAGGSASSPELVSQTRTRAPAGAPEMPAISSWQEGQYRRPGVGSTGAEQRWPHAPITDDVAYVPWNSGAKPLSRALACAQRENVGAVGWG